MEYNDVARDGLAADLRQAGYAVVALRNGREALDHLAAGGPADLILLDMLLPMLDGWQLLEQLPEPHAPVVVATATILTPDWAASQGCAGFLRKPIETGDLLAEVERCLGGPPA